MHNMGCSNGNASLERAPARSVAEEKNNDCIASSRNATEQDISNTTSPNKNNINNNIFINNNNNKNDYKNNNNSTASDKKTVRFNKMTVYHLHNIPLASNMTPQEKQITWYDPDEYDQFKAEAAECAGVKIVPPHGRDRHFAMTGDFDGREGVFKDGGATALNYTSAGVRTERCYNNENEYNDHNTHDGKLMCRRGLGYHFSRGRRRSRAAARSAVVAWQKALHDGRSDDQSDRRWERNLAAINKELVSKRKKPLEKSEMILALVSVRCSREAREDARWRGDADYRAAYPELHDTVLKDDVKQSSWKSHGGGAVTLVSKKTKRRGNEVFDVGTLNDESNARFKRQRTAGSGSGHGGSCGNSCSSGSDGDALSAATKGYGPNGVLQGKV